MLAYIELWVDQFSVWQLIGKSGDNIPDLSPHNQLPLVALLYALENFFGFRLVAVVERSYYFRRDPDWTPAKKET